MINKNVSPFTNENKYIQNIYIKGSRYQSHSNSRYGLWDHPFMTSAFFRGEGVKNWSNLPTDSSKKLPTEGGRGQKS